MQQATIRRWYLVHKWTSLICTAFLLMLCVTGLPLIFRDELGVLLGDAPPVAQTVVTNRPPPTLDSIVAKAQAARPGEVVQFVSFDDDQPVITVITGPTADAPPAKTFLQPFDARTGEPLRARKVSSGVLQVIETLHEDMFLGLNGKLFLGAMAALLVAAIVSGLVVYAPFMRKLPFGTVRTGRSARLKWLDLHNVLGITTVAWLSVVGLTGIINALNPVIAGMWRAGQLAEMVAPYRSAPPLTHMSSLDAAVATTLKAAPGVKLSTVAYPGSIFSSRHHYVVFTHGASPVTARLLKPALIDAETGKLTDMRDMPLYVRILFLSEPLHFGDYGGLALKIVWAALDLMAIAVLGSGLYLWLGRRRTSAEGRLNELISGGEAAGAP